MGDRGSAGRGLWLSLLSAARRLRLRCAQGLLLGRRERRDRRSAGFQPAAGQGLTRAQGRRPRCEPPRAGLAGGARQGPCRFAPRGRGAGPASGSARTLAGVQRAVPEGTPLPTSTNMLSVSLTEDSDDNCGNQPQVQTGRGRRRVAAGRGRARLTYQVHSPHGEWCGQPGGLRRGLSPARHRLKVAR